MTAAHLDASLPIEARVDALLGEMTLVEKVGQLFHTMAVIGPGGTLVDADFLGLPTQRELVIERGLAHFNLLGGGTADELAVWHNALQDLALETRLQIPITVSTDPRHHFTRNIGTGQSTDAFSVWPEALGLAAIGDAHLVEQFAATCRQDYVAVGLRVALHPQLDLATEPRWARTGTTFGEDPELVGRLGAAYVRGLLGEGLGPDAVAAMIKHFPGGGPLRDGEDSHFAAGREQIYPGGRFDTHLAPFREALDAGASSVMPSYGMPVGIEYDEVACGFNRSIVTGLLRERLGFDGIVCTDWGLVTDMTILGQEMPARAWGVEHLDASDRVAAVLEAGVDQFGGECCTDVLVDLVASGRVAEERIDVSVRRVLRQTFALGLFERRHVDPTEARDRAGTAEQRRAGHEAQARSLTILTNGRPGGPDGHGAPAVLPLRPGTRVHVVGMDAGAFGDAVEAVDDQAAAEVTILRLSAAHEPREGAFSANFHSGSLEYRGEELERILAVLDAGPTIVVVHLDRPGILTPLAEHASALLAAFGCSDEALVDGLLGRIPPAGRLPVELARSMAAVEAAPTDAPASSHDPLFPLGHGLDLPR